jgi:hypothetical protein
VWLTSVWLNGRTAFGLALVTSSWLRIDLLPVSLIAFTIGVILLDFTVQAAHVTSLSAIFTLRPDAHSRLVGGCMAFHSAGSAVAPSPRLPSMRGSAGSAFCFSGAAFRRAALLLWHRVKVGQKPTWSSRPKNSC